MTPPEPRRQRLSTRIVGLFLGLLLLVQLAGFGVIRVTLESGARSTLAGELAVGERVWRRLLDTQSQSLVQASTLLAADYGFRQAVASDDDTRHSAIENLSARIGAAVSAWVDTGYHVRNTADEHATADSEARLRALAGTMARQGPAVQVAQLGERLYQVVAVPLKAPVTIGWLVLGFPLDQALADDMKALSGLEVALAAPGAQGAPRALGSTLTLAAGELAQLRDGEQHRLGGTLMQAHRVSLGGEASGAAVWLLRPVDDALEPLRRLQATLALVTAAGVLVFGLGSVLTARRITTPLEALVSAAERLGRGDYSRPVEHQGRRDEIGHLAQTFQHMQDSIAQAQAHIRHLALHDPLTGLLNRNGLNDALARLIAQAPAQGSVAVVMLGLDRFKHVNDALGWSFGDQVLKAVASRLQGVALHHTRALARSGGDEFAVLLDGCDPVRAESAARQIAQALERPLLLEEQTVDVSAAFGVACWPQHGDSADALLGRAEVAVYAAKRKAVPCIVYDASIDSASTQTLSLLSELRRALEADELRLFLQPKVSIADATLIGAEALVRWQHPTRGMVPPLHFIPFAEQTGFVRQLTLWIFEACARQWPRLQALGLRRVSINLSTRDLLDVELPQRLAAILQRHGVEPSAFCLEITESAIMDEPQRALAVLEALSAAGYKLSIDDFGTGYSSLAYLKRLPVDELKIDKSFVLSMEHDADDAKIVRSTVDLAHNLGLTVVAEGVENERIWAQLKALRCDEGQGYHFCRPLPAEDLPAFAGRWREAQAPKTAFAELDG